MYLVDGREIAEALRDGILGYGQLESFYDETEIPVGSKFADVLEKAAKTTSAAVLSVVSDSYASRPWCRRELNAARQPRQDHGNAWPIQPCLALSALSKAPSRGLPELGRVSVVPWNKDDIGPCIDLMVRETMIAAYHRLMCRSLSAEYQNDDRASGRLYVNWVPDTASLLDLLVLSKGANEVVYPGHRVA